MKSVRSSARCVALLCVIAIAAGCAGTQTTALPTAGSPIAAAPALTTPADATPAHVKTSHAKRKAVLTIRIRIPKRRHTARRSRYISASTQGMKLTFAGSSTTVTQAIGLTPHDPRCTGVPLTCTIVVDLPAQPYKATLGAYNSAPVSGAIPSTAKLLSTASNVPLTVKAGKKNAFDVTLDGVVASLAVSGIPSGVAGTVVNQAFTVTAEDAGGNVIVGAYENPVTISDNDKTTATSVSTSGGDYPPANELVSSNDTPILLYSGLASNKSDTISASASGATTGTATFAPALSAIGPASLGGGIPLNAYGASSPVSFTVSEAGWTGAPFNKTLTATLSNDCSSVATISPAAGTAFTATLVSGATTSGSCTLTISDPFGQQLSIPIGYQQFGETGSAQSFVVPAGVSLVTIAASGAAGAGGSSAGNGGNVTATIPASAGSTLNVYVGATTSSCTGGYNGGGTCGGNGCNSGGGGESDVRQGGSTISPTDYRVVVAGGGGGGGCFTGTSFGPVAVGGSGGGQGGGSGGGLCGFGCAYGGGSGGTGYEVGGTGGGGDSCGYAPCTTGGSGNGGGQGTAGQGGNGGSGGSAGTNGASGEGGAGGGGGYYGGGGGGGGQGTANCYSSCSNGGGGGGGGGAYAISTATNVVYGSSATQSGNGAILITY